MNITPDPARLEAIRVALMERIAQRKALYRETKAILRDIDRSREEKK